MFEQFPYVNFHELNLDWLIQKVKECYSPDNPPEAMVMSVNGMTGDVVLYENAEVVLPAVNGEAWEMKRNVSGNTPVGIAFQKNSAAMRLNGSTWYDIYDEGNPPPYPVTSVNGQTGAVTINVPVQSVNGQTGNVTINVPVQSVNGQTGNVTVPVAFKSNTNTYLEITNAANINEWGIDREIPAGKCGISFEIESGHVVGYLNFYDTNDTVVDSLKILTPADIPSSAGVVSINGQDGVVVLTANDIHMATDDSTSIKNKIASMDSLISSHTNSINTLNTSINDIRADTANLWDETTNYYKGDIVYHGGNYYIATADNAAGSFAHQSWSAIVFADELVKKATKSSIAYVETTNTASQAIPSGAYVYWKDAMYTASTAISQYDALSTSNLTAINNGALNSLAEQIAAQAAVSYDSTFTTIKKQGRVCTGSFTVSAQSETTGTVGTLQLAYRPLEWVRAVCRTDAADKFGKVDINPNTGEVTYKVPSTGVYYCMVAYMTA